MSIYNDYATVKRYFDSAVTRLQVETAHRVRVQFNKRYFGRNIAAMRASQECRELLKAQKQAYQRAGV